MIDEVLLHVDPPVVVVCVAQGTPAWRLEDLKAVAREHLGDYRLALAVGQRTLALGERWNVAPSEALSLALRTFGSVAVIPATTDHGASVARRHPRPRRRRRL